MSDPIREISPIITPDTLRKINQVNKAFYETHTKKNYGRTDLLGSQYSGTAENFGFEMLLEARKLRMEKPSLKGVFEIDNYKYYFELKYSNMIETYEQQGMLEAVLKKDVFLSDKEYRIKFTNCKEVYIPRSEGWGALDEETKPNVYKDKFYQTYDAPVLVIRDLETSVITEIELELEVTEDFTANYYFYNEFATQKFIDSYSGGTLLTVPIKNEDAGLPFVWICEDVFKSLPPVDFTGNVLVANKPILTIGVDGHALSHIYPCIYGELSLPVQSNPGKWYLAAFSDIDGFVPDRETNANSKISKIRCIFIEDDTSTSHVYDITFEDEYIKISLSNLVEWEIIRDEINMPYYARTEMDQFFDNGAADSRTILKEAFDIRFSDDYLFQPYEGLCEDATSGIHVDILSDYSENSVPKKNGTIHGLGDFDGLPSYFKTYHDRVIHRSHVELYTIRDRLNRYTQKTTEKQTAGLIFDTGMPQKDLKDLVNEQEPAIVYQADPNKFLYVTDESKVISKKNVLTEITFNDKNTFGNCNIPSDRRKQKFIYHGNRTFSIGTVEFDPEIEMGRVYYVNNDSIAYKNNALEDVENRRSPLTLARICDIPTEYEQLMHIENLAATNLFDPRYVRTEASFDAFDAESILNEYGIKVVMTEGGQGNQWIYPTPAALPRHEELVAAGYQRTINYNSYIPIQESYFEILAPGTDYEVGDKFYALLGGTAYDGEVTTISSLNGAVTGITVEVESGATVAHSNIDGAHTSLNTTTTSTELGSGLQIELNIPPGVLSAYAERKVDYPKNTGIIAFAKDGFGGIHLYKLETDWSWTHVCQVEGEDVVDNPYDLNQSIPALYRDFNYVFFEFILDHQYTAPSILPPEFNEIIDYESARGHKDEDPTTDLSQYIVGMNMPDTYFRLVCTSDADGGHFNLQSYTLPSQNGYKVWLPRFNRNNTCEYYNPTNRLIISNDDELNKVQPTLFIYAPSHDEVVTGYRNMTDTILVETSNAPTYNDYTHDFVDNSGKLVDNVYYYPQYEFSDEYNQLRSELETFDHVTLLNFIREKLGSKAEPFKFEGTSYQYSNADLVNYIMDRYPFEGPAYIKDGLKVHGYADEQVIDPSTGKSMKNTTGGFVPLTSEMFDSSVTADGRNAKSEPVNIFIIDDVSFTGFGETFKVFDENDRDITSTAIVIWRGNKYICRDDQWIPLAKRMVDGYYNHNDEKFYYDASYTNMITPEVDIIYHDLTMGQYYKWNGNNYVLIII